MPIVRYLDQSGGMKAATSRFLQNDNEYDFLLNVNGYTIGSLQKRPGYAIAGSALGAQDIMGLSFYHQPSTGIDRLITVLNGSQLYYSTGGAFSAISNGSLSTGLDYKFANFLDSLYMVGGRGTNYATSGAILNTTFTGDTGMPKGLYIKSYLDQLYVLNTSDNKGKFAYSSVPDTGFAITWPALNYEILPGETIMGGEVNSNRLCILTQGNLYRWDTSTLDHVDDTGTVSSETIQTVGPYMFFVSRRGIEAYSGGVSKRISKPIQKVIDAITPSQLSSSCAATDAVDNYFWFIGSLTYEGVTYSNVAINYTISTNSFYLCSYADAFKLFTTYIDSNAQQRIYGGTASTGSVMKFAQPVDNVFSDNGTAISAKILSKKYDLGVPEELKQVKKIITFMSRAVGARIRWRTFTEKGVGEWQSEVEINKQIQKHHINPDEGYFIQFELTENSTNPSFIFDALVVDAISTSKLS